MADSSDNIVAARARDGRVLFAIGAGFLAASLSAAIVANGLQEYESHYAAMAFSAVCLSAAIVLGVWGLVLVSREARAEGMRKAVGFLRRVRWKSSRRKTALYIASVLAAGALTHFFLLWKADDELAHARSMLASMNTVMCSMQEVGPNERYTKAYVHIFEMGKPKKNIGFIPESVFTGNSRN